MVRSALADRQAIIGFCGGPFTLAGYLIEGAPSRDYFYAKALMYGQSAVWHALMEKLTVVMSDYVVAQVRAGANAIQLFDSWVGTLSPSAYKEYVFPYAKRILDAVKSETGAPTIHFGTGNATILDLMVEAGGDVMCIDSRYELDEAWARIGYDRGIQGNMDATRLLAGWEATEVGMRDVLRRANNRPGHIFNLGHGVAGQTDPDLLRRLVDTVHTETAR